MKTITSIQTAPTQFEMFILEHLGTRVDLSSNVTLAAVGIAFLMVPFFLSGATKAAAL